MMSGNFTLSCCSTVDLPYSRMAERGIPVLFYTYTVDDTVYVDWIVDCRQDYQWLLR